jgi:competence protein ComEC
MSGIALVVASAIGQAILFQNHIESAFATDTDITITVKIHSYFKKNLHGVFGDATVVALEGRPLRAWQRFDVELRGERNLYEMDEVWTITGVFKPISGVLNPRGFDSEKYAFQKQLVAKFVIDSDAGMRLINWGSQRAILFERYKAMAHHYPQRDLLQALAFGSRHSIANERWQVIVEHGLSHLFAISGLHIGLAFLVGWGIAWVCVPVLRLPTWLPAVTGLGVAWWLGYLSGYSLPTQRALLAISIVTGLGVLRIKPPWKRSLECIALVVLIFQPSAVLSASFWLSFGAVFILLSTRQFWAHPTYMVGLFKLQLCFAVGLLPFGFWFFGGVSVSGLVTNLLAVPVVSFVVMPLVVMTLVCLGLSSGLIGLFPAELATALNAAAGLLLALSHWVLDVLILGIEAIPTHWWSPDNPKVGITLMIFVFTLVISGTVVISKRYMDFEHPVLNNAGMRVFLVAWGVCLLDSSSPNSPSLKLTTLDVGHGLAMVFETPDWVLVYDTGNAWQGNSFAQSVIEPFVREARSQKPIWLVVSHDDADHSAGAGYLVEHLDPYLVLSPSRQNGDVLCLFGREQWIGNTHFEVLWPPNEVQRAYNPHSCVVKVSYKGGSIVLTGDIDKRAEFSMLNLAKEGQFNADIMSVPHHGSESSSSAKLIKSVSPKWAVAGTDFNGRWALPKASIKQRYIQHAAKWFDTGDCGAISLSGYQTQQGWLWVSKTLRDRQPWYRRLIRRQSKESVAACYRQLSQ